MTDPLTDTWITAYSSISPKQLHAIGVVAYFWNGCESNLFTLFQTVAGLSHREAWAIAFDMGNIALCQRIRVLAALRFKGRESDLLDLINNALDVYEICRMNRNQLTHFTAAGYTNGPIELLRISKKPDAPDATAFAHSLKDIRRVARETKKLGIRLQVMWTDVIVLFNPGKTLPWPLPKILPLPVSLWTPPPQNPKAQKRPPRSSRV
jgi:hypothetical protein